MLCTFDDPDDESASMTTFSKKRRELSIAMLGAAALSALPRGAQAQGTYPSRPITFICPWPAGGTADATMRALCAAASRELGQPVVLENKPGAAGMLGTSAMVVAAPDGYTIGQVPMSVTRFSQLGTFRFDPMKDITYIARTNGQTFGIAVRPDSRYRTLKELVAAAKTSPGTITYATSGVAGQTHVGMEEFAMKAGIKLNHIPFKGGSEALQAVMGGHVDVLADSSSWAPQVESGKLILLATWGEKRTRFDAPTLREAGYDVVVEAPNGVGAPKGIDPAIHARLRSAFRKATQSPEFTSACAKIDSDVMYLDADDYRRTIQQSVEHEKRLIEALHLREKLG